jgi:hypothetical protein
MQLIKNYFEYMRDPSAALKSLIQVPSFKQSCWGYFVAALSWVLFFNIGDELSVPVFLLKLLILFVAELTAGCFVAALSGLFLTFRQKNISSAQLFVLIGSAGFIKSLLIAFALISAVWPEAALWMLAPVALLLVFALQLGYLTMALQRVSGTSVSLGLLAWLFGAVPVGVLFALLGVFFVWMILLI